MALTPADVHNVAFSRARVGKRGYSEQEVDLFIDLVEQELIRHIEEDVELRHRNAELRNREGGLKRREAELAQREAVLQKQESEMRKDEAGVRKHQAQLAHQESQLAQPATPLPRQIAQIRYREAQVAQREVDVRQRQAELARLENELREQEVKLQQLLEQHSAEMGLEATNKQVTRPYPQQLRAVPTPVAVNGASHLEETRVASVHGRHDMERMAIRAVTDTLGNTVTETVHERTRRSAVENAAPAVTSDQSDHVEQLKKENAELARSLGLIKSAAALLAAALEQ